MTDIHQVYIYVYTHLCIRLTQNKLCEKLTNVVLILTILFSQVNRK